MSRMSRDEAAWRCGRTFGLPEILASGMRRCLGGRAGPPSEGGPATQGLQPLGVFAAEPPERLSNPAHQKSAGGVRCHILNRPVDDKPLFEKIQSRYGHALASPRGEAPPPGDHRAHARDQAVRVGSRDGKWRGGCKRVRGLRDFGFQDTGILEMALIYLSALNCWGNAGMVQFRLDILTQRIQGWRPSA